MNINRFRKLLLCLLGLFIFASAATPVRAHNPDQSYLYLRVHEDSLSGRFEATFKDLNKVLGLELKNGSSIEDVRPFLAAIQKYAYERASFSSKQGNHKIVFEEPGIMRQGALGDFLLLNFTLENTNPAPKEIDIDYSLFFEKDPSHRALVVIEYNWKDGIYGNEAIHSLVIGPDSQQQTLTLSKGGSILQGFLSMIRLGIWHIWIGFDHILFLLALALPSVLVLVSLRDEEIDGAKPYLGSWYPAERFKPALIKIVKIITFFTIAHTITLSLAALNLFTLPARFVESMIALSIAVAAVHNIRPVLLKREWLIAFIFGLFHGFGFAGILAEKGFAGDFLLLTLFGFNLGVELGQLAIISIMFPVLFLLRKYSFYSAILLIGSILLIFASLYWFVERAFDVDLPLGGIILRALGLM